MPGLDGIAIDIRDVTGCVQNADGTVTVQVKSIDGSTGITATLLAPMGLFGLPTDPGKDAQGELDPNATVQALFIMRGAQCWVLPLGDPRAVSNDPNAKPGDNGVRSFGASLAALRFTSYGKIVLGTTDDGTLTGKPMYLEVVPTHKRSDGKTVPRAIRAVSPDGVAQLDSMAFRMNHASGASLVVGGVSGKPGLETYAKISAKLIKLDGQVSCGPAPSDNAAKVDPLLKIVAALAKPVVSGSPVLDAATAADLVAELKNSGVAL